jgi:hypothetical protein
VEDVIANYPNAENQLANSGVTVCECAPDENGHELRLVEENIVPWKDKI